MEQLKQHWDKIYENKPLKEVSWYEPVPETSLSFIENFHLPKSAAIIDVGGGDSFLSDKLLKEGYTHLSVLDISKKSLERAKIRMTTNAAKIKWIESNVLDFNPSEKYDLWHDRAAFHFLTNLPDQKKYVRVAYRSLKENGMLLLGTFSDKGPDKCSGLPVQQYSEDKLIYLLKPYFKNVQCVRQLHPTPFNTVQEFLFCSFQKVKGREGSIAINDL